MPVRTRVLRSVRRRSTDVRRTAGRGTVVELPLNVRERSPEASIESSSRNCGNAAPKYTDVADSVWMQSARQEDHIGVRRRIDPQARAREPGVAVRGADGKQIASIARERRIDVPAESADAPHAGRRLGRRHRRHARLREDARRAEPALAEQHAREQLQVARRAEQSRVSGDAAHAPRGRIVDDAAQGRRVRLLAWPASIVLQRSVGAIRGSNVLGGRNPVSVIPSGTNTRALQIRIERLARDARRRCRRAERN